MHETSFNFNLGELKVNIIKLLKKNIGAEEEFGRGFGQLNVRHSRSVFTNNFFTVINNV